jgi:hypothetical protein
MIRRGFRIVKGGGTFVIPVLEKIDILSLELPRPSMSRRPRFTPAKGVP